MRVRAIHTLSAKYNLIKSSAYARNLDFTLQEPWYLSFALQPCTYCDGPAYGGLDRIDSSLGYCEENVANCCSRCNYMKSDLSQREFILHVQRIAAHMGGT